MSEEDRKKMTGTEVQKKDIYSRAVEKMKEGGLASLKDAVSLFSEIPGYLDSDLLASRCLRRISEIKSDRKEKIRNIITYSIVVVITSVFVSLFLTVLVPGMQMNSAQTLMARGDYREARSVLKALGDYGDSEEQLEICEEYIREESYQQACRLEEAGNLTEALTVFEELGAYKNASIKAAEILDARYREAENLRTDGKKQEAMRAFSTLNGYLDSEAQAEELKEELYRQACELKAQERLEEAAELFAELGDYKDSSEQNRQILSELEKEGKLPEQDAEKETEPQTGAEDETAMETEQKRLQTLLIILAAMILLLAAAGFPVYVHLIRPALLYRNGLRKMEDGDFEEAREIFLELEDYRDSRRKVKECERALLDRRYAEAMEQKEAGEYETAIRSFTELNGYRDSIEQIRLCREAIREQAYQAALQLKEDGKFEEGAQAFDALRGYKDSTFQAALCRIAIEKEPVYEEACRLMEEGNLKKAMELFRALNNYRDSRGKIRRIRDIYYGEALELKNEKLYPEAISAFVALEGYKDSLQQIAQCREAMLDAKYREAVFLMEQEEYEAAIDVFRLVKSYGNSQELIEECKKKIRVPRPFNHLEAGMKPAEAEEILGIPVKSGKGKEKNSWEEVFANVRLMDACGYMTVQFFNESLKRAVWHGDFAWEPYERENGGLYPGSEFTKYAEYYTYLFGNCTSEYLKDNHKGVWWRNPRLTVDVSGYDYVTVHFIFETVDPEEMP